MTVGIISVGWNRTQLLYYFARILRQHCTFRGNFNASAYVAGCGQNHHKQKSVQNKQGEQMSIKNNESHINTQQQQQPKIIMNRIRDLRLDS